MGVLPLSDAGRHGRRSLTVSIPSAIERAPKGNDARDWHMNALWLQGGSQGGEKRRLFWPITSSDQQETLIAPAVYPVDGVQYDGDQHISRLGLSFPNGTAKSLLSRIPFPVESHGWPAPLGALFGPPMAQSSRQARSSASLGLFSLMLRDDSI